MEEILKAKEGEREEAQVEQVVVEEVGEEIVPEPGAAEFSGGEEHLHQEEGTSPEVMALEEEKKNLIDRLARLQADFDNYRKRVDKEKSELRDWSKAEFIVELLPVIDNFERALSADTSNSEGFVKGVEMIYRSMLTVLEKQGVAAIEAEGATLDSNLHHAVIKEAGPEGVAEDTIIGVLQKGYKFKDRVLRPAMVKVAE